MARACADGPEPFGCGVTERQAPLMIALLPSVDCVLFATPQNFCKAVMAATLFFYWLSQFDYNKGCLYEIAGR
jgi:hypothetical protein